MMRSRVVLQWLFAVVILVCLALLACMAAWMLHERVRPAEYFKAVPAPPAASAPQPAPVRIDAKGRDAQALGSLLVDRPAFASDVVFLVVAAMRERCEPDHAHELAAMAARARLPVLAGVTDALGKDAERREALLEGIRSVAARAPCRAAFEMDIGAFRQRIEAVSYAAAFPDSYFDPGLSIVPNSFGKATLGERAADDCNRVAYAVLPLDEPRAWQCTALREAGRQHVLALCHASPGSASDDTALRIRGIVDHLPPTCQ
jgi:hypothetical protein